MFSFENSSFLLSCQIFHANKDNIYINYNVVMHANDIIFSSFYLETFNSYNRALTVAHLQSSAITYLS